MRKRSIIWLLIIIVVIGVFMYFGMTGFQIGVYRVDPLYKQVNLGLDLTGGVYVVYQAQQGDLTGEEFSAKFDTTMDVLRERLDKKGYTEATIVAQGSDRIRVEIPTKEEDANKVFETIGDPAVLEFKDSTGKTWVTGDMVKSARAAALADTNEVVVELEFDSEGGDLFGQLTKKAFDEQTPIEIFVDNVSISSANVEKGPIYGGSAYISGGSSGGFSQEEAENLAVQIASGALPLSLTELESRTISASLGEDALSGGLFAGMVGLIGMFIFLLIYYRLPGLVACITLTVYAFLTVLVFAMIPAIQLTLPGIAGTILSIGMAVDANVIIFERFKEELALGKTLRTSMKAGFHKAMGTILDSNTTTVISGIVITIYGVGTIKGFGYTLIIGIVLSMITAVVLTRVLMNLIMDLNIKNLKLYTIRKSSVELAAAGKKGV